MKILILMGRAGKPVSDGEGFVFCSQIIYAAAIFIPVSKGRKVALYERIISGHEGRCLPFYNLFAL